MVGAEARSTDKAAIEMTHIYRGLSTYLFRGQPQRVRKHTRPKGRGE